MSRTAILLPHMIGHRILRGLASRTLVVFITDNGSAFPFAKANTYLAIN